MNKIEYEGIAICARIESQDADNADQKVKCFLKVRKRYKLLWEACLFSIFVFPIFYSGSHFTKFSIFTSLKMRVKLRKDMSRQC